MMPGVNYVIYDCSSATTITLQENVVAVITQDRVRDDNVKRQIKNRPLCFIRLFLPN